MKRKNLFAFTILLLGLYLCFANSAITPSVSFMNAYAEVDVPLKVSVNGYPKNTTFSYQWKVGDTILPHTENSYTPTQKDLEQFISVTVTPSSSDECITISTYFSKLPVLYLTLENDVSRETYAPAFITLQGNSNYHQDDLLYTGSAQIRGRGNSTWESYPKKPFRLKLDTPADLLGMGENRHWVLFANYADETLMRNKIAYDLSGVLGMPYMESTWVSIIINGEYAGNYLLCEQIRIDESRIPITDLEDYPKKVAKALVDANIIRPQYENSLQQSLETDLSWLSTGIFVFNDVTYDLTPYITLPDLTGGFLMEIDGYFDKPSKFLLHGQPLMFSSPENAYTNDQLMTYAADYFDSFFYALLESDNFYTTFENHTLSYTELFDIHSLAQYILIQEVFFNYDAALKSTYLYKDINSLAHIGPIWDMDWSSGRTSSDISPEQWCSVYYTEHADETLWYSGLLRDPYFLSILKELWDTHYDSIVELIEPTGVLEQAYYYLYESGMANTNVWFYQYGFQDGYEQFYQWMQQRIHWLSQQFVSLDTLIASVGIYNPNQSISITLKDSMISIYSPDGSYVELHLNGICETILPLEHGSATWLLPADYVPSAPDILTVYLYDSADQLIGSNYTSLQRN